MRSAFLSFARSVALVGSIGLALAPSVARGQAKPPADKNTPSPAPARATKAAGGAPKGGTFDVKPIAAKLRSGDETQIKDALDEVRLVGPAGAVAASEVAEALARGLSLPLTQSAVETLGDLESDAGSASLALYATHRNPRVRRAAIKALARTKGPPAAPALKRALADSDAAVRGTAASGLGALKAKDAVADLVVALDHRVNEAAASIGQLCAEPQCEQLATRLGKLPFDVVTGGLDQVLFRPTAEISDDAKIKVIGRVRELGTIEANKFLRDVQKRWPASSSSRVRQAIDQGVTATAGGTQ